MIGRSPFLSRPDSSSRALSHLGSDRVAALAVRAGCPCLYSGQLLCLDNSWLAKLAWERLRATAFLRSCLECGVLQGAVAHEELWAIIIDGPLLN